MLLYIPSNGLRSGLCFFSSCIISSWSLLVEFESSVGYNSIRVYR